MIYLRVHLNNMLFGLAYGLLISFCIVLIRVGSIVIVCTVGIGDWADYFTVDVWAPTAKTCVAITVLMVGLVNTVLIYSLNNQKHTSNLSTFEVYEECLARQKRVTFWRKN